MLTKKLLQIISKLLIITLVMYQTVTPIAYAQEVIEPTPSTNSGQAPEPTPEIVVESSPEPTPEPLLEPTPEPTPESNSALPEPTPEPTPQPTPDIEALLTEAPPSPTPEPLISLAVDALATHSAEVENVASVSANTGINTSQGADIALVSTGDAVAIANMLAAINTNLSNSQIAVIAITPTMNESGDIDLNALWQQMQATDQSILTNASANYPLTFTILDAATVNTLVLAGANTGINTLSDDAITLYTGNALSIANVGQLINASLFNAQVLFSIINILPGFSGNIILPRPMTQEQLANNPTAAISTTGIATSSADVVSNATTGSNTAISNPNPEDPTDDDVELYGSNDIQTGDSVALGSVMSFINTTIMNSLFYSLIINNLGSNPLQFVGLNAMVPQNSILQLFSGASSTEAPESTNEGTIGAVADVATQIVSTANTGYNNATGALNQIITGTAQSAATLVEFTNLNIMNGQLFSGILNVAGNWFGNIIIAHPDLMIAAVPVYTEAEPGQTIDFRLSMANKGYDTAYQPTASFTLPDQVTYAGSDCQFPEAVIGQTVTWQLPTLTKGAALSCTVKGTVSPDFSFDEPNQPPTLSLVKKAYAASHLHTKALAASASIRTIDPELDMNNNRSSGQFTVVGTEFTQDNTGPANPGDETGSKADAPTGTDTEGNLAAGLAITASHNVNEYVYAGDTVTFTINISNTGEQAVRNARLVQVLYGPVGERLGSASFELGTIQPGRGGKLTFGITLENNAATGYYSTAALATGEAENGTLITSNESDTEFRVLGRSGVMLSTAQVMGAADYQLPTESTLGMISPLCELPFNVLPYILMMILSALWFVWARRKTQLPMNTVGLGLYILTALFFLTVALYSSYVIARHYDMIPPVATIDTLIVQVESTLNV